MGSKEEAVQVLTAKFGAIFPHLDERQRRLLMGAEARALGHGGIRLVARAAGSGRPWCRQVCMNWRLGRRRWAGCAGQAVDASGPPSWILWGSITGSGLGGLLGWDHR